MCTPKTCGAVNANCGQVSDGCGGLTANCGSCDGGDICGGAGIPSVCGRNIPDGGGNCTNLCMHQAQCSGNTTTTVTGVVLAPTDSTAGYGNPDPISNALVYVPNATVSPFDAGVTCDQCTSSVSGSPLVSTYSNVDGTFTLKGKSAKASFAVTLIGAGPGFAGGPDMGHVIGIHAEGWIDPKVFDIGPFFKDPIQLVIDTEFDHKG